MMGKLIYFVLFGVLTDLNYYIAGKDWVKSNEWNELFFLLHSQPSEKAVPEKISGLVETVWGSPVRKGDWLVMLSTKAKSPPLGDIWQWLNANIALVLASGGTQVFSLDISKMLQNDSFVH